MSPFNVQRGFLRPAGGAGSGRVGTRAAVLVHLGEETQVVVGAVTGQTELAVKRLQITSDGRIIVSIHDGDGHTRAVARDRRLFLEQPAESDAGESRRHDTARPGSTGTLSAIGLERAQAVQRYLYEQYQVPLHKMNVISYGEEKPVAPNKTKAGRAQNRRVVIKVLA